jgi:hypothetical protein
MGNFWFAGVYEIDQTSLKFMGLIHWAFPEKAERKMIINASNFFSDKVNQKNHRITL